MKHIPEEDPPSPLAPQELYYLKENDKDPPSLQSVSKILLSLEMIICMLGIITRAHIAQHLAFHSLQRKAYHLFSLINSCQTPSMPQTSLRSLGDDIGASTV